jgi:hypothetical protein
VLNETLTQKFDMIIVLCIAGKAFPGNALNLFYQEEQKMKHSTISTLATVLICIGLLLGACGGQSGIAGQKVTASGFVCPEPSPRLEVTSKKLNLFVWTEYIPQDIIDCFGLFTTSPSTGKNFLHMKSCTPNSSRVQRDMTSFTPAIPLSMS